MRHLAKKQTVLFCLLFFGGLIGAQDLAEREQVLEAKEAALKEQLKRHEKALDALKLQFEMEKKALQAGFKKSEEDLKKRLEQSQKELKSQSSELQALRGKKIEGISQLYEKMEPKSAAKILENMDVRLSAQVLSQVKPQRAAEILSKMNADKARSITEASFGRKISQVVNEVPETSPIAPIGSEKKIQKGGEIHD